MTFWVSKFQALLYIYSPTFELFLQTADILIDVLTVIISGSGFIVTQITCR